jgi:hypothetical protein
MKEYGPEVEFLRGIRLAVAGGEDRRGRLGGRAVEGSRITKVSTCMCAK